MRLACATMLVLGCHTSSAIDLPGDGRPGAAEDVITGLTGPGAIAVDATHVYFTHSNGNVARIAKTDGAMLETIASGQNGPGSLDVTTDRVCWVNTGDHAADFTNGSVHCASKLGGADQVLSPAYMPSALAIDGDTAYWVELDGQGVRAIGLDGQNYRTLDSSPTDKVSIALNAKKLGWSATGTEADVVVMDRSSGDRVTVSMAEYAPSELVLLGDDVYWASEQDFQGDGAVRVSRAGGAPVDLVPGESFAHGLIHVADTLYWMSDKRVRAASIEGGTATTIAEANETLVSLVSDGEFLYWSEFYRGAIVRIRL